MAQWSAIVTIEIAVTGNGNLIPPIICISYKKYRYYFVANYPPAYTDSAFQSGLLNSDDVFNFFVHLDKHNLSFVERAVLFLLNNDEMHKSVRGIDFAKTHEAIMLSFRVFTNVSPLTGQFTLKKKYISTSCEDCIRITL